MIRLFAYFSTLLFIFSLFSCTEDRPVTISFYFWKTIYQLNNVEKQYLHQLRCKKLYIRIMDVDAGESSPVPISPITFKDRIPDSIEVVPVVFIVNQVLKSQTHKQLDQMSERIVHYVNGKVKQSGKENYAELQIDCDWTRTTRDNYFYLLDRIQAQQDLKAKLVSATLRLHQLKNQGINGIPPVGRVMLMCYNMGNLRKYGTQNSILEQQELEKYVGKNLKDYPRSVDIGLPLFSWAVVFRQKIYAGIARRLNLSVLSEKRFFDKDNRNMYTAGEDLPSLGLKKFDEVRWESIGPAELARASKHLQKFMSADATNIIYFHLDEQILKPYTYETLEKTAAIFH